MQKPPFLKDSPASAAAPKDAFANRPQKSGTITPDGPIEHFENRPQKSGASEGDSKSVPSGGKFPFAPAKNPSLPAKFGK